MEESSVAAVVTDPPYGLEFMSVGWDTFAEPKGGPSLNPRSEWGDFGSREHPRTAAAAARVARNKAVAYQEFCDGWAAECFRVLKPGGYLLAFSGTRTYHRMACAIEDAGFEIRDSLHWLYGSGFPKGKACLKPSHEPIVMARKPDKRSAPLPGLDKCRVAHASVADRAESEGKNQHTQYDNRSARMGANGIYGDADIQRPDYDGSAGRWPPNILLTHDRQCVLFWCRVRNGTAEMWECVPGCPVAELDRQSGHLVGCGGPKRTDSGDTSIFGIGQPGRTYEREGGGASRFFPVFRYQAKAPSSERPKLPDGSAWPTVKPLELMRWLVRLVTPPGGTVLDLFAGTGTTGQAAALEGFRCILIERDPVALELIKTRLGKPAEAGQDALF